MSRSTLSPIAAPGEVRSDLRLVRESLDGNDDAWNALVEKYKRLIYSIPIKYGLTTDDAADIFQSVCLEALSQLERLREPGALPAWLMQSAAHKSCRAKSPQSGFSPLEDAVSPDPEAGALPPEMVKILEEAAQEQSLRDAVAALPSHCARLLQALFFVQPAIPYADVAKLLGMAGGSMVLIRGRCLKKLRRKLESSE